MEGIKNKELLAKVLEGPKYHVVTWDILNSLKNNLTTIKKQRNNKEFSTNIFQKKVQDVQDDLNQLINTLVKSLESLSYLNKFLLENNGKDSIQKNNLEIKDLQIVLVSALTFKIEQIKSNCIRGLIDERTREEKTKAIEYEINKILALIK